MATKIKLARFGKMRSPYYRIVVADARNKRDGRSIETIGRYEPKEDPSFIEVDSERAQYWLSVGAQPTDAVAAIFRVTGDWQKFKGEPAPEPMKVAAPKADKHAAFADAAAVAAGQDEGGAAITPKKKAAPKKAAKADDAPVETEAAVETPAVETPAVEVETPAAEVEAPAADETPAAVAEVETPAADEAVEAAAQATAATEG